MTPKQCICGEHVWLPLHGPHVTLASPEDAWLLAENGWFPKKDQTRRYLCRSRHYYVNGRRTCRTERFHNLLIEIAPGLVIDHSSRNGLDNRRGNLRLATPIQNAINRLSRKSLSRFRGVTNKRGKWVARITVDKKLRLIGTFATEMEAATAYNNAAKRHHGDFAIINENV